MYVTAAATSTQMPASIPSILKVAVEELRRAWM
jgi:hypothetical protein